MNRSPGVILFALLGGCLAPVNLGGNDGGHCSPATCAGCCDGSGVCQAGEADSRCGAAGAACRACSGGAWCQGGQCGGAARCALPALLDWAAVAVGDSALRTLELKNPTGSEVLAMIGGITSSTGDGLAFSSPGAAQTVKIPAGASHRVEVGFSPTERKAYLAKIIIRLGESCPDQVISLTGTGVDAVLGWAPDPLDCGYLTPGVERVLELTFTNQGAVPAQVSNLRSSSSDYRVLSVQPVTVPARGVAKVSIAAKPGALGPRSGRLDFDTDLPRQPAGVASLKCYGGGRDIDLDPSLDLGPIGYFAGSSSSFVTGKLTIRNAGTQPTPPDSRANLHLGGGGVGPVYWAVRAKPAVAGNTATADELCVGQIVAGACTNAPVVGTYDSAVGLEASGLKALLDVPIRVTPSSTGLKEWDVVVYSDDPDEPESKVTIRAQALALPPCDYEVIPPALNFGQVAPGSVRELELRIRNKGQNLSDTCVLSGLAIAVGSHPAFSLVGGPIVTHTLQPGSSRTVGIRFAPTGATPAALTPVAGQLEFSISAPFNSHRIIPLAATLGASCLSIVPNRFDFGTIRKTCNSATRTFLLYNICGPALEVSGSTLLPATAEFVPVNLAGIAPGTLISSGSSPATFSLKYQPVDESSDSAAFVIKVKQGAELVDYVIPLAGAGDTQGLNSDTLLTGGNLKADILLVIDNSGSMLDKQTSLGAGFPSFIRYANSVGLDYQIAVTSSDMGVSGGRIIGSASLPKILRSSTPNLNALFSQKVQLGTSGSSTEELLAPATAAVTAPLVSTDNAGLVRPGATLGIVSVSDAEDQSPQTVSFYVNQLLNVKPVGQLTFSAIAPLQPAPPTAGCTYDGTGGAPRTVAAAAALGGMTREICTPDWDQGLLDLGPSVFGSIFGASSFQLSNIPDLTGGRTISVKVNGVMVPPVLSGGAAVWAYDATANRLIFEPAYVPAPGDAVTATYFVACIP